MNTKVINDSKGLLAYKTKWDEILEAYENNNPFIEFDWVHAWLQYLGDPYELMIFIVEDRDEIVAFVPLVKEKHRFYDVVLFTGFGQANYIDIVAVEGYKDKAIHLVFEELSKNPRHLFILNGLLQSQKTAEILTKYLTMDNRSFCTTNTIAPFSDLSIGDRESFIKKGSKKHGADRKEKRLKNLGRLTFAPVEEKDFEKMFSLHEKRWRNKMDTSGFTKGQTYEFFKYLAEHKHDVLGPKIDGLFLEDTLIAFIYGFTCRNRYVLYALGHDDDFGIFSPGKIIIKDTISDCYHQQHFLYDMSIGYEPYKLDWATGMDQAVKLIFPASSGFSHLAYRYFSLKEKMIRLIKKNRAIVLFKRNTLGRFQHFFQKKSQVSKVFRQWVIKLVNSLLFYKKYEIYRFDIDREMDKTFDGEYKTVTAREFGFFNKNNKVVVNRLFKKEKGFCLVKSGELVNYFWASPQEIKIEEAGIVRKLPENTVYLYDWDQLDVNCIQTLQKDNPKLISIYIPLKNKKDLKLMADLGFVLEHCISKMKIFGMSIVRNEKGDTVDNHY